jgi:hypothetical protein
MTSNPKRGRQLVRLKDAMQRLGVGHSRFYTDFVRTGRLTLLALGPKSRAVDQDQLDAVIAAIPVAEIRPVVPQRREAASANSSDATTSSEANASRSSPAKSISYERARP